MNKMNWKWTLVFAAALVGATVLLDAQAWAGKLAPPPPPIHYQINYFTAPGGGKFNAAWAMNQSGAMVGDCFSPGTYSGFLYDPALSLQQAFDLNDLVQVPKDWRIRYAYGINDRGAITAAIVKTSAATPDLPGFEIHGIVIDRREPMVNGKWVPHFLPDVNPAFAFSFGRDINNNGDIVGVFDQGLFHQTYQLGAFVYNTGLYSESGLPDLAPTILPVDVTWSTVHLNDPVPGRPLQIAGLTIDHVAFRYTVETDFLENFPALTSGGNPEVESINGLGEFCGRIRVPKQKGGQYVLRPFRYNPSLQSSPTLLGSEIDQAMGIATDINDSRDVAIYGAGSAGQFLYHNEKGMLNLDNLVMGLASDVAYWRTSNWGACYLTERYYVDVPDDMKYYPRIGITNTDFGCLLVPVP